MVFGVHHFFCRQRFAVPGSASVQWSEVALRHLVAYFQTQDSPLNHGMVIMESRIDSCVLHFLHAKRSDNGTAVFGIIAFRYLRIVA